MDLFFVLLILTLGLYSVDTTCNSPENISGATLVVVGSSPYPDGTQVEYTCNIGYRPYGDSKLYTCQGGVWVGNFECKKITCSYKAPPANGKYSTSPTYEIGTEMRLECYSGYDRNGPSRLLCMADGTWDPDQETTCTPKNCRDFGSVMHGNALQNIRDGIRNSYGSVVTITCDDSYVIEGSPHVECQASGSWGDKPSCELVSCPTYPGASTGCVDYTELSSNNRILDIFCKSGPNISVTQLGEYDVYCNDNQVWEGDPLACYCDCKVVVNETQVTVNNLESNGFLKHGRTLSWTCKKGLKNMTENVVCKDGVIGTNLCDGSCLSNPSADNAEDPTSDPPYPENTHLDLECRRGYHQLEGTSKRYTCNQNEWSGNLTCKQTFCPSHPDITNGTLVNPKTKYPVDYKLNFECDRTYTLAADLNVTCLPNGTWSSFNQTKCVAVCESYPHVDNATVVSHCAPCLENSHIDLSCNQGFHKNTQRYICNQHEWNGNLTCKQIFCPSYPNITNGTLVNRQANYPVDYKLMFGCDDTYTLEGDSEVNCLQNGTWSSSIQTTCVAMCESCPQVDNAVVVSHCKSHYLENSHLDLSCSQGFHKNTQRYTCNQHVWNGNLTCKQIFCPSYPNITNGRLVNPQADYPVGYKLEFGCDPTYTLTKDSGVTCLQNGTWSLSVQTTCVAVCESCPQVDNARNVSHCTPPYLENSHLDLSCIQGYHKNTQRYTCNQHEWNGTLTCKQIFCSSYPNITNGFLVTPKANYPVGYKLEFGCDPTFNLTKDSKVNCLPNGTWSSSIQTTCVPACEKDPKVDNAEVVPPGKPPYPENSHVDLECDYGYRQKEGTIQRYTCTQHVWMGGNLTCEQIVKVFPHIPTPEHGKKIGKSHYMIQIGDTIEFECNSFYKLEGPESMTSTLQGTWEPAYPPVCELFVELIILVIVLAILVVFLVVLYILYKLYRIIETVIQSLLNDANMITEVLLKDTVQEAIKTLEDTWNPLKDSFVKFVLEITKCKLTNLAEKKKTLWKLNCKHLRSQADKDLEKVEKYKIYITAEVLAWEDFERNVDQLLKSAKVAATIPLYKPHWFSKLRQSKPDNYVNEQTKAKSHILEVKAWLDKQKKEGGDTKTEDLDTLMPTLQSEEIWRPFTQLKKSLETIMHFWSANPETGEDEETLL